MRSIVASLLVLLAVLGFPVAASAAPARPTVTAAAASASAGSVVAMSCANSKSCVGLANYVTPVNGVSAFLRNWNGKAWGPAYGAVPGSANDGFAALSCLSATFCVAVGSTTSAAGGVAGVWDGKSWSLRPVPAPNPASGVPALFAISCVTPRFCVAVGDYYTAQSGVTEGFADLWNGAKWALDWKMPAGSGRAPQAGDLNAVSCKSADSCVAAGDTYTGNLGSGINTDQTYRPVALVWHGRWTKVTPPVPAGGHGLLNGVSCWSAKRCLAVGAYYPNKQGAPVKPVALAEFWNGTKWTASKPPSAGPAPELADVSCVSGSSCVAVGSTTVAAETKRSFADSWNGKKWTAVAVATPKNGTGKTGAYPNSYILYSVTCAAPAACVAFGIAGPLQDYLYLSEFAEVYNGKRLSNIADS